MQSSALALPTPASLLLMSFSSFLMSIPMAYFMSRTQAFQPKKVQSSITIISDIGSKNSTFQLVEIESGKAVPKVFFEKTYSTQYFAKFSQLLERFLKDSKKSCRTFPNNLVLSIAGPVRDNTVTPCFVTKWGELSSNTIMREFNLENVIIINVVEAIGNSLMRIEPEDYIQVNEGVRGLDNEKVAVIGLGTGLAHCTMIPAPYDGRMRYYVWAAEGAHAAFSPTNKEQCDYMLWIMKKRNLKYMSSEKALSDPGVRLIYEFMHEKNPDMEYNPQLRTEEIIEQGTLKLDTLCNLAVDFLIDVWGNEIGNMVCREKILCAVFLVGPITLALKDYILGEKKDDFLKAYHNKDLMKNMVEKVPIFLVTKHKLALLGGFVEGQRMLELNKINL